MNSVAKEDALVWAGVLDVKHLSKLEPIKEEKYLLKSKKQKIAVRSMIGIQANKYLKI